MSGSVIVDGLAPDTYNLMLRLALNCAVQGENPRVVTVKGGDTPAVAFTVTCKLATGTLRVTTVTTGVDLDENGYVLRVDGFSVTGASVQQIWHADANGTATLSRIPAIGSTYLTLYGLAVNCNPDDVTRRPVAISGGDTAAFTFTLTCTPATDSVAYVTASSGVRRIVIASATGGGPRRLTSDFGSDEDPAWSPDGRRMAFTADRDGNREIYVIDADGSNSTRLTAELWADYAPAWSPDGRIAFASDRNGRAAGIMDVYVMNADGSNPARLTTSGGGEPAWSRDGRLAYAAANCDDFACQPSIVVRSVSGADATVVFGPGNRPSWSPDGRKIAYDALTCDFYFYQCVPGGVRVGRLDSTDVIPLAAAMQPAWRP
jgi:hypothetical protein